MTDFESGAPALSLFWNNTATGNGSARGVSAPAVPVNGKGKRRMNKDCSDVELLRLFQNGDEQAFVELYTRRRLDVYRYALKMFNGDEDRASDAFQEAFIRVYENAATFRTGDNVRAWMLTITRNICLNMIRDDGRRTTLDCEDEIPSMDDSLEPERMLERSTVHEALEQAIGTLNDDLRGAIVLREYEGLSYAEIAETTGTNEGVVRQRIWRAKKMLRKVLAELLPDLTYDESKK